MNVLLVFVFSFLFLCNFSLQAERHRFVEVVATESVVLLNPYKGSSPIFRVKQGDLFPFVKENQAYVKINVTGSTQGWLASHDIHIKHFDDLPIPSIAERLNPSSTPYYNYAGQENYRFPNRSANQNFDINNDGFVEIKASGRSYYPSEMDSSLWSTIVNDPAYKKIPRDVLLGPIDIDTRSRINLEGKLADDLYVRYEIEQEPEMPGKYDVEIDYKDHLLQFFHLNANYEQGHYVNVKKSLRGAQYIFDDTYNLFQVSMGKERSESHKLENFGTGTKLIKLSHKYVFPGSVRVYINNIRKDEGTHFEVDYYNGTVSFPFVVSTTDYYKIIYEISNPIADYLPVLARRNFQAIQYSGSSRSIDSYSLIKLSQTDNFVHKPDEPTVVFPTFNISVFESVSSDNTLIDSIKTILIDANILQKDFSILNYSVSSNVVSLLELSLSPDAITPIIEELDSLFAKTAFFKEAILNQFSSVQVFPDSFLSIEGLILKDSIDIFYSLISKNILNPQGFIVSNLLSKTSLFDDTSPFVYYDRDVLLWLKSFLLEKNQLARPRFLLSKNPVSLGSVSVYLNEILLVLNTDYSIDYSLGIITFFIPLDNNDDLEISYDYFIRKSMIDEFIGKNMTGPYLLSFFPVLDGTTKIVLNDTVLTELDDYIIDYDKGEIYFNVDVPFPSIFSVYYDYIKQEKLTQRSKSRAFDISATYINEYVPADEEVQTLHIVSENAVVSNGIISLSHSPLTNTENIQIAVNGDVLTLSNYSITSNYKGHIQLINTPDKPALSSASVALVSYSYIKSFRTKASLSPMAGTRPKEYVIDGVDYYIDYLPIKYKGLSYITYDGNKLQDESFSVDYGEDGQTLVLTFFLSSEPSHLGSKLQSYPNSSFTLHYDYTPQEVSSKDAIKHHMFGTTIKGNLTNYFSLDGEFVFTENNFGGQLLSGELSHLSGNGQDNYFYYLGKTNILENSEQIFLNDRSQTRDVDYVIIYKHGTFRFLNKSPGSSDVISADFQYSADSGVIDTHSSESGYATRISTHFSLPSFNATSSFKYIDQDFMPIGAINDSKGNSIFGTSLKWDLSSFSRLSSQYSRQKLFIEANQENTSIYDHIDIFSSSLSTKFFNYIDSSQNFNYRFQLRDPDQTYQDDHSHDIDTLTASYQGSYSFGPTFLRSSAHHSFSRQLFDYIDQLEPKNVQAKSMSYQTHLLLKDAFLLGSISIKPSYFDSFSNTASSVAPTSSFTHHRNFDFSSSFSPVRSWSFSPMYKWSSTKQQTSSDADIAENKALSYGGNTKYEPFNWFSTFFAFSHKEDASVLLNQQSNIYESKQASLKRFSPHSGLLKLGMSPHNLIAFFVKDSHLSYSYSDTIQKKNDRRNISYSYSTRANLTQLNLLKSVRLHNLSYFKTDSTNNSSVESSTASKNMSASDSLTMSGQVSVNPSFFIAKYATYSSSFRSSSSSSSSTKEARSVTGNQTKQNSLESSLSHSFSFNPPQLRLPNLFSRKRWFRLGNFSLSLTLQNNQKDSFLAHYPYHFDPSSNTFSRLSSTSSSIDHGIQNQSTLSSSASPFNLLNLKGSLTQSDSYYNRNSLSLSHSFFQAVKNYQSASSISPFKFISFTIQANQNRSTQWLMPTTNISKEVLLSTQNETLTYTNKWNRFYSASSSFKPFRFFSLTGTVSYDILNQLYGPITSLEPSSFKTETYKASASLNPLKALSISASYSTSQTNDKEGQTNSQTVSYTPIKTTFSKISISYTRSHSYGFGLNSVSLANQEQGENTIGETKTVDRDHVIQNGSLSIDVSFPINNAYVQRFTIEGEGYLKDITDYLDTDSSKNSYSISGVVLTGTLSF